MAVMAVVAPRALAEGEELVLEWRDKLVIGWLGTYAGKSVRFRVDWDPEKTRLLSARLVWRAGRGWANAQTVFRVLLDGETVGAGVWPPWAGGELSGEADVTGLLTRGSHTAKVEAVCPPSWPQTIEFEVLVYVRYEGEKPEHEQEKPPAKRAADYVKWALLLGGLAVGVAAAAKIAKAARGGG